MKAWPAGSSYLYCGASQGRPELCGEGGPRVGSCLREEGQPPEERYWQ